MPSCHVFCSGLLLSLDIVFVWSMLMVVCYYIPSCLLLCSGILLQQAIYLVMDFWFISSFWLLWGFKYLVHFFWSPRAWVSSRYRSRNRITCHRICISSTLPDKGKLFLKVGLMIYVPPAVESAHCLVSLPACGNIGLLNFYEHRQCRVVFYYVLICISLLAKRVNIFWCLLASWLSSPVRGPFKFCSLS